MRFFSVRFASFWHSSNQFRAFRDLRWGDLRMGIMVMGIGWGYGIWQNGILAFCYRVGSRRQ